MKTWQKGLTLIELMILVAIIGILAAVAIPKFEEMIKRAKEKERAEESKGPQQPYQNISCRCNCGCGQCQCGK